MDKLKDKLWEELEKLDREGKLSAGDLELAHKLSDTIKNLDKICILEDEMEGGYSQAGDWEATGRMSGRYDKGSSYANRGKHYVRGHYSRSDGRRDDRGRYSGADGRSKMMEHLEMALDSADEKDREDIRRFIRKLEDM